MKRARRALYGGQDITTGLVLHYKLLDTTNSIGGNDLTLNGTCPHVTGVDSVANSAYSSTGAGGNFFTCNPASLPTVAANTGYQTICMWIKTATATLGSAFGTYSSGGFVNGIMIKNSHLALGRGGNWWIEFTGSSNISDNNWHHLAIIYNNAANTQIGYVDGVNVGSLAVALGGSGVVSEINLFQFRNGFSYIPYSYNGSADNCRLYNVAKTEAQIQYLFGNKL